MLRLENLSLAVGGSPVLVGCMDPVPSDHVDVESGIGECLPESLGSVSDVRDAFLLELGSVEDVLLAYGFDVGILPQDFDFLFRESLLAHVFPRFPDRRFWDVKSSPTVDICQ